MNFNPFLAVDDSTTKRRQAFTLIEISVVLVIIGLIVGGVLVGRDLIRAATIRAHISQLEKFRTAFNTFKGQYGYLPGDIPDPDATNFGLVSRQMLSGRGNGNGVLEPRMANYSYSTGEVIVAWRDLATKGLIAGSFDQMDMSNTSCSSTSTQTASYLPPASISSSAYWAIFMYDRKNYMTTFDNLTSCSLITYGGFPFSAYEAWQVDSKIDDGLPGSGKAIPIAVMVSGGIMQWAGAEAQSLMSAGTFLPLPTTAMAASDTTCVDNGNVAGVTRTYSYQTNRNNKSCWLTFTID